MDNNIVIVAVNSVTRKQLFYAIDRDSGCPWWASHLFHAKFFSSEEEADKVVNAISEQREDQTSPERILHCALELDSHNPKGEVDISVYALIPRCLTNKHFKGELR